MAELHEYLSPVNQAEAQQVLSRTPEDGSPNSTRLKLAFQAVKLSRSDVDHNWAVVEGSPRLMRQLLVLAQIHSIRDIRNHPMIAPHAARLSHQ